MSAPSDDRRELARRLSLALGVLSRRIRPGDAGLSVGYVSALSTVLSHDGIRASDLARIEKIAAPSATRMVADLEEKGLVKRKADPSDGRATLIRATAAGRKAIERARGDRALRMLELLDAGDGIDAARLRDAVLVLEELLSVADSV